MSANGTVHYRAGTSYAIGTIIDGHLADDDCAALYDGWRSNWPERLEFHGGNYAITAEMILEVPQKEFLKVYGRQVGNRILDAARSNI